MIVEFENKQPRIKDMSRLDVMLFARSLVEAYQKYEVQQKQEAQMTTEEMQAEIARLKQSKYVKTAKKAENAQLRQKLYQLRCLEKKGKQMLAESDSNANAD